MSVRPIRTIGDPILRSAADPVRRFDDDLRTLVADMFATMRDVEGVGLAAPQIGVGLQIFVYEIGEDSGVFINPRIELGDEMQEGGEGCLSVPGLGFDTPRRQRARVSGLDEHGQEHEAEAMGLLDQLKDHGVGKDELKRLLPAARERVRAATGRDLLGDAVRSVPGVGPLLGGG